MEIAVIVVTFGAHQHDIPLAALAAVAAVLAVAAAGVAVRRPLARIPENVLKLLVGVMLTSFGTFWVVGGAGVSWPGGDSSLIGVIALVAATSIGLVRTLGRLGEGPSRSGSAALPSDQ